MSALPVTFTRTVSVARLGYALSTLAISLLLLFNAILPVSQNAVRVAVFAVSALAAFLGLVMRQEKIALDKGFVLAFIAPVSVGALGVMHGLLNDNPGALFVTPLYVVWPFVYTLIFLGIKPQHSDLIARLLNLSLFVVASLMVWYVLNWYGIFPVPFPFDFGQLFNPAIPQMQFYSISSLVFLLPFTLVYTVIHLMRGNRRALWLSIPIALATLATYWSGRRALMLAVLIVPPLLTGWYIVQSRRRLVNSLAIGGYVVMLVGTLVAMMPAAIAPAQALGSKAAAYITSELQADTGAESERVIQTRYLLSSWDRSPIIGNGVGEHVGYVRNQNRIWEYEAQYPMMLSNLGLAGLLVFALSALWVVTTLLRLARRHPEYAPVCAGLAAGLLAFIFANNTNPYFQAYGHLWAIFLPAAYANALLVRRD